MHRVGSRRRENHLGVTRRVDRLARPRAVGDADPAQLDILFRRNSDLGMRFEAVVAAAKLRPALREDRLEAVRPLERRLICSRPELTAGHVADVAEGPPVVAGRVFPPARDSEVLPAAVAAAGVGQHDVVPAVRQQLHLRCRGVGAVEHAHRQLLTAGGPADGGQLRSMYQVRGRLRDALLEQQDAWPGTAGPTRIASASDDRGARRRETGGSSPGDAP